MLFLPFKQHYNNPTLDPNIQASAFNLFHSLTDFIIIIDIIEGTNEMVIVVKIYSFNYLGHWPGNSINSRFGIVD